MRVMMYSHDGFGLGHLRRNANIASRFVREVPGASVLMLVGSPAGAFFELPPAVDVLKLPFDPLILKARRRTYTWRPRNPHIAPKDAREIRALLIGRAAELFRPRIFLVDHVPTGVWGELLPVLQMFRSMATPPKVILGLRDILDAPEVVREAWRRDGLYQAIDEYYDKVLIYGCDEVYDTASRYGLDGLVSEKLDYCGYVCSEGPRQGKEPTRKLLEVEHEKLVVVTGGAGYDAYPMMAACMKALRLLGIEHWLKAIFLTGPLMEQQLSMELHREADGLPVQVMNCVPNCLDYLNAADLVVTMGGYNSVIESVGLRKRTLVIPRKGPSAEQKMRAKTFADLGLVQWIDLEEATPSGLAQAITDNLHCNSASSVSLDMNGREAAVHHMKRLLELEEAPHVAATGAR